MIEGTTCSNDNLQKEAEDIWNMLNNLAETDPEQYAKFVRESTESAIQSQRKQKHFVPSAGFDIKTRITNQLEKKVVEHGQDATMKLFVNICSHQAIEAPKDRAGRPVDLNGNRMSAHGLEIPLVVGESRKIL